MVGTWEEVEVLVVDCKIVEVEDRDVELEIRAEATVTRVDLSTGKKNESAERTHQRSQPRHCNYLYSCQHHVGYRTI